MPPLTGIDPQIAIAILIPLSGSVLGGLWWLRGLDGRVTNLEADSADTKEDIKYIRDRIDRALEREIL